MSRKTKKQKTKQKPQVDTVEKFGWVCDHFQNGRVSPNHGPTRGTWFLEDPAAGCDWPGSHPHLEGAELWEGGAYWSMRSTEGEWRRKYEHTTQQCKHTHTSKNTHTNSNTHTVHTHSITHLPQELGSSGSHFNDATSQPLTFHHRRHRGQTVSLHQPACHPRGCRTLSWWHNDSQAVVTAATHGPAPGIYHEANQEAAEKGQARYQINCILRWVINNFNTLGTEIKSVDDEPPCRQSN